MAFEVRETAHEGTQHVLDLAESPLCIFSYDNILLMGWSLESWLRMEGNPRSIGEATALSNLQGVTSKPLEGKKVAQDCHGLK